MRGDEWVNLAKSYDVLFGRQRRRAGVDRPPRFLMLGPLRAADGIRPTHCAGNIIAGRAVVDYGVLSESMRSRLESAAVVWCAKHARKWVA